MATMLPNHGLFHKEEGPIANIAIRELQHPSSVLAPNVWGQFKEQPAWFNIHLQLRQDFDTAASLDKLDESTIHYGELAKKIRAACTSIAGPLENISKAGEAIQTMATKSNGRCIVREAQINLELPKASMHGQLVSLVRGIQLDESGHTIASVLHFEIHNMQLKCLIGVNDYERTASQPVIANLGVFIDEEDGQPSDVFTSPEGASVNRLERRLADLVQNSDFETLESLADFAAKDLGLNLSRGGHAGARFNLRLEKPKAIAFADAAIVEVGRTVPEEGLADQMGVSSTQLERSGNNQTLNVNKPYV